jgi:hypothetical protein
VPGNSEDSTKPGSTIQKRSIKIMKKEADTTKNVAQDLSVIYENKSPKKPNETTLNKTDNEMQEHLDISHLPA